MNNRLKTFSKCIKNDENISLKNKCLFGRWISMASKLFRKGNLPYRFEDWLYRSCKVKRQASYNYRNLFKLMSVAPKLINCKINATCFVKNYEILLNYFKELETQDTLETRVFLYVWRLYFILWRSSYHIKHWSRLGSLK